VRKAFNKRKIWILKIRLLQVIPRKEKKSLRGKGMNSSLKLRKMHLILIAKLHSQGYKLIKKTLLRKNKAQI
jgi:hypothetical protein